MTTRKGTSIAQASSSQSDLSASIAAPAVSNGPEMVALPRAEWDAMKAQVAWLTSALSSRTGTDAGQVIQRSTTIIGDYDTNPRHDPDYMLAAGCVPGHPADPEAMKRTFAAAQAKIAARQTAQNQPGRNDQYDWTSPSHEQRRAQAAAGPDMSMVLSQGGVSTRSPSGQVTTTFPAQITCELGHPAEPGYKFCAVCGSPLAAPPVGKGWDEEQQLRAQRLKEEGIEPED
jgi:hypothetical protein